MSIGGPSLTMSNLYSNPQLLGALFPDINVQAIQAAFQAQQYLVQQPLGMLNQQLSALSAPLAAWQALQGDLQALQSDAANLAGTSLYQAATASSSNPAAVSVTTTGTPTPGTYVIGPAAGNAAVVLARSEIVNSAANATPGVSGSFSVNGVTVNVNAGDTLATIAQAINAANAGVSAVVLAAPGGSVLSIQGDDATPITFADPNGILQNLGVLGAGGAPNVVQSAQYAQYSVNGVSVTAGKTNTDTATVPGLSFTLLGTSGATLTVAQNQAGIQSAVQQFVNDFNRFLADSQKYTGKGGVLEGDGTIGAVTNRLFAILDATVPGQPASLQNIGQAGLSLTAPVGSPTQFTLALDATKLQSALSADPAAFAGLWRSSGGIATQISTLLSSALGPGGGVTAAIADLQQQQSRLQTELNSPTSPVNQMVNAQLQSLQDEFNRLLQALVALSSQGSAINQYVAQLTGQGSGTGGRGGR